MQLKQQMSTNKNLLNMASQPQYEPIEQEPIEEEPIEESPEKTHQDLKMPQRRSLSSMVEFQESIEILGSEYKHV